MMTRIVKTLLPAILLLVVQGAGAVKEAQAVLMSDKTLYFVYDEPVSVGSTYLSKTVSKVWRGDDVICESHIPGWRDDSGEINAKQATKVVFDASFAQVRPKRCGYWFMDFHSLTEIEHPEYLNTSEVTDMYDMFANCISLITLNLAGFNTGKVTNMEAMFLNCQSLTTIYVGAAWTVDNVSESSDNMFKDCTKLKGGNNTVYNSNCTDKEYARIDAPGTPGYLSDNGMVYLWENADNSDLLTSVSGQTKTVTLVGRTLQTGGWNTLAVPFDIKPVPAGWTVKKLTGASNDGSTLTLTFSDETTKIEAGKPYLVKVSAAAANPTFSSVVISNNTTSTTIAGVVSFVPVINPTAMTAGDKTRLFVTGGNKLTYPNANGNINGFRAYFQLPDGNSGARQFVLNFGDDNPTVVGEIQQSPVNSHLSTDNESWYDLSGRKYDSKPTKPGIYVHKGEKQVIQ